MDNVHDEFIYWLNRFVICWGFDAKIKVWEDMILIRIINGNQSKVQNLKFLQGLNILVSTENHGTIMIWNLINLSLIHVINSIINLYKCL